MERFLEFLKVTGLIMAIITGALTWVVLFFLPVQWITFTLAMPWRPFVAVGWIILYVSVTLGAVMTLGDDT